MPSFRDSEDRTWSIEITIDAVKRVRRVLDVDLLDLTAGDPPLLSRLDTDIALMCDVVFVLVQPAAEQKGVSDEQFGAALGGQAIAEARKAFWTALADFFQGLGRTETATAIAKQQSTIQQAIEAANQRIGAIDTAELVRQTAAGNSSTNLPASSASTPAR